MIITNDLIQEYKTISTKKFAKKYNIANSTAIKLFGKKTTHIYNIPKEKKQQDIKPYYYDNEATIISWQTHIKSKVFLTI